jgi:hypothetical protein
LTQVRVLSTKAVVLTGVALLVIGVGLAIWFVLAYGGPDNQLEAIKTAGTFVVGGGGAAALYLTARRQRSNEMALQQKETDQEHADRTYALQERVAAATEAESLQRRITDSYGAALEQLGSDKPAVRLGSLYALERLAQDNPAQRETIVNVICAYLRIAPETPSGQEVEVRSTAQRILAAHLRPADSERFWPDIDLDLSGAVLRDFDLGDCVVRTVGFKNVTFENTTRFAGVTVTGRAEFRAARFLGPCRFVEAKLSTAVSPVADSITRRCSMAPSSAATPGSTSRSSPAVPGSPMPGSRMCRSLKESSSEMCGSAEPRSPAAPTSSGLGSTGPRRSTRRDSPIRPTSPAPSFAASRWTTAGPKTGTRGRSTRPTRSPRATGASGTG